MKRLFFTAAATAAFMSAQPASAADFSFWHALTGPAAKALDKICDQFNASQTTDHITCAGQGTYEEELQKAVAAYRAKKQSAIVMFYDVGTPTIMLSGAVEPVSKVMKDADVTVDWSQYLSGAMSYYAASDGTPMSLPFNASTLLFYINTAKFAKVGITTFPKTWEEVNVAARKLKQAGESCPFVLRTKNTWRMLEQSSAVMGAPIADLNNGYGGLGAKLVFNKTDHVRLMKAFAKGQKDGIYVDEAATRAGKAVQAFADGECDMIMESSSGWGVMKAAKTPNVEVGLLPIFKGQTRHNTFVGGASLWTMKGFDANTYRGVARFFAFLRKPEIQVAFAKATGYVPVTKSGIEAFKADTSIDADTAKVINTAFQSLSEPATKDTQGIRLGFFPQIRKVWVEEMAPAFTGERSVEDSLNKAVARGNAILRKFQKTYPGMQLP